MESLYTKYRPQTFEQVVGQKHVVGTLKRAVLEGKVSHAYLFCGPRGTGKTTMARLLAKALLCRKAPGQLPDGTCEECQLIAAGNHPDVVEIDAASNTGVDNVREEIISRANYAPVRGKGKVYIIDEVHMLTTAAFNALLKTLEEPPAHVTFILCTTDPQKVLGTVLSRVQRFDFHAIGNEEMLSHLQQVCEAESFQYDARALELIVRHARGGMRDALTSLEQLSVFGDGVVSLAIAQDFLGEASGSLLAHVSTAIAKRDVSTLFEQVNMLVDEGRDVLQFTRELAAHIRNAYVMAAVGPDTSALTITDDERTQLAQEVREYRSADRLARALTILGDASNQMRTASNQRLVLEIAFTRLARPTSDLTLESLAERIADLEYQLANGVARSISDVDTSAASEVAKPPVETAPTPVVEKPAQMTPAPVVDVPVPLMPTPVVEMPAQPTPLTPPVSEPVSEVPSQVETSSHGTFARTPGNADEATLTRRWKQIVKQYREKAPAHGSLLMNSTLASDDGSNLLVLLPKGSEFASAMLGREEIKKELLTFIEPVLGMRTVTYGESSLQNKAIADAERALKPQEPPRIRKRDAQPQGSTEPAVSAAPVSVAAPVPTPVSVVAPATVPAPAPAPT
ncbi:DNA polymerase III subunit gamma/tau, partial [Lancefieldella rimae]|uniref:DNA polymerase III subunit gamma/tau n=1 Tax=Lancefieldella rimae TaxID=1383 RepID=UPI003A8EAD1F